MGVHSETGVTFLRRSGVCVCCFQNKRGKVILGRKERCVLITAVFIFRDFRLFLSIIDNVLTISLNITKSSLKFFRSRHHKKE